VTRSGRGGREVRILIVVVTLLMGSCDPGSRHEAEGPSDIPTLADALQGPGSKIADGFTVAEGSWLIGDAIPGVQYGYGNEAIEGWNAVLIVDEEPMHVLQAYLDEALSVGYTEFGVPFTDVDQFCSTDRDLGIRPSGTRPRTGTQWIECRLAARRPAGERFDTIFFQLSLGIPPDCFERCESYARYLDLSTAYSTPVTGLSVPCEGCDKPDIASVSLPQLSPPPRGLRLADVGEPIGADQRFFDGFQIQKGSEVVAPGTGLHTAGTGNYTVILHISGEPGTVLEAYRDQFEELCCAGSGTDGPPDLRSRSTDDGEQLYAHVAALGGLGFSVITTPLREDRPAFARVDVFND
jgi:hypothetical protein